MAKGKITNVREHKGIFYARKVVPQPFRHLLGGELLESLGPDQKKAMSARHAVLARFEDQIAEARRQVQGATPIGSKPLPTHRMPTLRELAQRTFSQIVETDAELRRSGNPIATDDIDEGYVADLRSVAAGLAQPPVIAATVGAEIEGRHPTGSPEWIEEGRQIAGVTLEALTHTFDRADGRPDHEPKHRLLKPEVAIVSANDPLAARIVGPDSHKTLAELVDLVIAEKKPKPGTANEYRVAARMFAEHLGAPRAVYTITRLDVLSFKGALQNLPLNYTKRFAGLPIPNAIKANAARAKPFETLDGATTNKWLSRVNTLLTWAMNNGVIPPEHNPAAGVKVDQGKKSSPPRIPFAPGDIAKIFAAPLFSPETPLGEEHWTLLVGLHTGLRASEIAQIKLDSIRRERGVLVFAIEEETKNEQSRRIVPVHSTLIALGIEGHVESLRRAGATHLFPEWFEKAEARKATSTTANQTFANYIPRWFNRTHLPSLGITDPRKKFHSLRHTLKTALARAGVSREVSDAITGHDDDSSGAGYVHEQSIETMRAALEHIHFDGLDLSALIKSDRDLGGKAL